MPTAAAQRLRAGLTSPRKSIPCSFFYDAEGSRLFEQICTLPEYYLTRAERSILEEHAGGIAARFEAPPTVVELGSGSAAKTRLLIAALLARHQALCYAPIDISREALAESTRNLGLQHGRLAIRPIAEDYSTALERLPELLGEDARCKEWLVLWLGSSIGNLHRDEAAAFLRRAGRSLGAPASFLVGIDLRKEACRLEAAYDDAAGVTARFNLNILAHLNREYGADFDLARFRHVALYDPEAGRVEMHLESLADQRVLLRGLALDVVFEHGERIHTENCYKYSFDEIDQLAAGAGLATAARWLDRERSFSLNLLR